MDENHWIWIIIYLMPVTIVMWLLGMWANHEDYKKEHNIKGWSDRDMNVKQFIGATIVSVIVGSTAWLGGVYYGSLSMFDTMYENVDQHLNLIEADLANVSTKKIETELEQLKQKVLNRVPSREDLINMSADIDEINERIVMLSTETQALLTNLKMDVRTDLNNTKTELNNRVESSITAQSDSVKKELGKLYDRLDILYKDLENVSNTIDKAKETFFGKMIIKE
tara:strand:+ start:980 stop:1651 length:672 start_codon:yes stop_codon:yes gene_type:complete